MGELNEEINNFLQFTEAQVRNLQKSLRASLVRKRERQQQLEGLAAGSPEELQKLELERERLQIDRLKIEADLTKANRLASSREQQFAAKQQSKERDRQFQRQEHLENLSVREREIEIDAFLNNNSREE